ncbi:hypothetical protein LOTGIDRAFT_226623, partial [Lottia gigantea]
MRLAGHPVSIPKESLLKLDSELLIEILNLCPSVQLTGTKLVCGEGGCGACTVMISKYNPTDQNIHHYSVNACLMPVCSVHGLAVTTTEGIGSLKTRLHPVQEQIAKSHGSQCGFCTPGMVMSMYALLRNNPQPTMKEIEKNLEGNLCRCTGYRPILDGYRAFSKEDTIILKMNLYNTTIYTPIYDPSQEPIFPPDLKVNHKKYHEEYLVYEKDGIKWYRPVTLSQILDLKYQFPQAKIIVGNTEVGIETTFKNMKYPVLINAADIPKLTEIQITETGIKFGASVTLSKIEEVLQAAVDNKKEEKIRGFVAIIDILKWFAGKQIRNAAAIGGNIMTASPISDLNPIFQACGVVLHVQCKGGKQRNVPMDENFFTGYRKTQVQTSELLLALTIPFSTKNEYIQSYKQSIRKDDDIAIVNSGMRVVFKDQSDIIEDLYLSYGGMAPTTVMAKQTMMQLKGRKWNEEVVKIACEYLEKDLPLSHDAPGGTVEFRRTLTTSFFFKFYLSVAQQLAVKNTSYFQGIIRNGVSKADISATVNPEHEVSRGTQIYDLIDPENKSEHGLWKPLVHSTAYQQATGEAVYMDDMRTLKGELSIVPIYSAKAHANITKMHVEDALAVPGVKGYIDYTDVKGSNHLWLSDEKLFAEKKVETEGAVIGCIVADSHEIAIKARRLVKIEYEEHPAIISIQDAIDNNSFLRKPTTVQCGDIENEFKNCKNILEGEVYMGAQEQFYFETQSAIAIPKENDEMDVYSSTQCPTAIQASIADIIGVPSHKVRCLLKRIGGGFGGKETQCVNAVGMAATAGIKFNCPVRCVLDREDDMVTTGTRHPILAKYKVGFSEDGRLHCLDINTYFNCGDSLDLSEHVMMVVLNKGNNCYNIPNFRTTGHLCKTNIRSNTAFRGFGLPQGVFTTETVMQHIVESQDWDPLKIRQLNFFKEGDRAHINQIIKGCHVQDCWDDCLKQSNYKEREQEVKRFNRENRWRKRGIFIMPMQFGIGFGRMSMNQGGAFVSIYTDGSVLLAHGGVEMGQGINVKMIQVASGTLGIPTNKIHIIETGTNTVPNTSATAASTGTDLNGMAV